LRSARKGIGLDPLLIGPDIDIGVRILYEDPSAVGADRLVDAVAAYRLYGGPACIVDFGTATTFDALSAEGDYLGGAIAPGIGIAADALFQRTAKLPRVELARPPAAIGRNTVHSMQSGLLFGYVSMVEGMVARFRRELGGDMKVIATGGLAEILARETPVLEILAPWLTLDGLRMVYDMNRGRSSRRTGRGPSREDPQCHRTRSQGKQIILGVTGSIAAYKAADLASKLARRGPWSRQC
jgi:type III pantothenate kinase